MFRVVTWNMGSKPKRDPWQVLDDLKPTVALVQEAPLPTVATTRRIVPDLRDAVSAWRVSAHRPWRSAVVAYGSELSEIETVALNVDRTLGQVPSSHPRTFCAAVLNAPDGKPITVVSLYGLCSDRSEREKDGYAYTTLNRALSDLTPLIESSRGCRMIIAGDLNITPEIAEHPKWGRHAPHHELVLARLEAFGFTNGLQRFHHGFVQTRRATRWRWQLDWVFTRGLDHALHSCDPLYDAQMRERTGHWSESFDHWPVEAIFDFRRT